MKYLIVACLILTQDLFSQSAEELHERMMETLPADWEDEASAGLEHFKEAPIDLNEATEDDLVRFPCLNALQVQQFFIYRKILGPFINLHELQAIPGWDPKAIHCMLPFVKINTRTSIAFLNGASDLKSSLEIRWSPASNEAKEDYLGKGFRLSVRYQTRFKNVLRWGLSADKDGGEPFFSKPLKLGFDFYSPYLVIKNVNHFKTVVGGDFMVNFGQGLIQWQSLAFKKGGNVLEIKRQSETLVPHTSTGEYRFYRGLGITWHRRRVFWTAFASYRRFSANVIDSLGQISSFNQSGYHRTASEMDDRHNTGTASWGGSLQWKAVGRHISLNTVFHRFSRALAAPTEPYQAFQIVGRSWENHSLDFSFTYKNVHFFGEYAISPRGWGCVQGLIGSLHPQVSFSLLYRNIKPGFQSLFASALTENADPTNENGFYTGLAVFFSSKVKVEAFYDIYRFPWLKYRVYSPSGGREYLVQATYTPSKTSHLLLRFRSEIRSDIQDTAILHFNNAIAKKNRILAQFRSSILDPIQVNLRYDIAWYKGLEFEYGFNGILNLDYDRRNSPFKLSLRLQYFDIDGFNARISVFESDIWTGLTTLTGNGFRWLVNVRFQGRRPWFQGRPPLTFRPQLRVSQTVHTNNYLVEGDRSIKPNKSLLEIKVQVLLTW